MNSSPEFLKLFELSRQETQVLFAVESWFVRLDINRTQDLALADKKTKWLLKWESGLFKRSFFGLIGDSPPQRAEEVVDRVTKVEVSKKRALIFCEALVFTPYFNIQERQSSGLQPISTSSGDRKVWTKAVFDLAERCGTDVEQLKEWITAYETALREVGGRRTLLLKGGALVVGATIALAVTGGFAAPAVGGLVGSLMGLSGAAATSAGLAFLGGGAIATGGLGMAGGTAALIGGGALMGGAGGLAASRLFAIQDKAVLSQIAKLEASILTFAKDREDYLSILQEVIDQYTEIFSILSAELKTEGLVPQDRKRIEKTAEYYKRAIKRLTKEKLKRVGVE